MFAVRGRVMAVSLVSALALSGAGTRLASSPEWRATAVSAAPAPAAVDDSLFGRSGKLRARLIGAVRHPLSLHYLARLFGGDTLERPGIYPVATGDADRSFSLIKLLPFAEKRAGRIGGYRIGFWPGERRRVRSLAYATPAGFIEVTRENQDTHVSEHFRLSDFLTHDQEGVWPKYLVLREELVDKLELVIQEVERTGRPVRRMTVMSGFRTPQYNANGGETGGRANDSRHMYGDAADVFVDNDGDGRMDDLNGDGRVDPADARVIQQAVDRVEQMHPDLAGGVGVYRANSAHGPFAHVDVRGYRARWGLQ